MPNRKKNDDLHGNVPDTCPVALLLVDVINDLDFPNNAYVLKQVPQLAGNISSLKMRCRKSGIPAIYVNDNWGKWRSEREAIIEHARREDSPGHTLVEALLPQDDDYFAVKPKHSPFTPRRSTRFFQN